MMKKIKFHPMWLIIFTMLGLSLSEFTQNTLFLIIFIFIGIIMMLTSKTPSQNIGFKKSPLKAILVWIIVLLIFSLMIINYVW